MSTSKRSYSLERGSPNLRLRGMTPIVEFPFGLSGAVLSHFSRTRPASQGTRRIGIMPPRAPGAETAETKRRFGMEPA